jgi:hypothetical protein
MLVLLKVKIINNGINMSSNGVIFLAKTLGVEMEMSQTEDKGVCVCVCVCLRGRMYGYQFWPAFPSYSQKGSSNKPTPDDVIVTRFAELQRTLVWQTDVHDRCKKLITSS